MKKINLSQGTKEWLWCIIAGVALFAMLFFNTPTTRAQQVVKQGTQFVQQSKKSAESVKTQYTYKAADGKVYPIYKSAKGKCYIIRVSKKTGKEYKQYLPEVTKQLGGE